jgi:hypothetical protein
MTKKQRGRLITGWRQVVQTNASSRKRSTAIVGKPAAAPATEEPPPKEQWDAEGGKVVKPAG